MSAIGLLALRLALLRTQLARCAIAFLALTLACGDVTRTRNI